MKDEGWVLWTSLCWTDTQTDIVTPWAPDGAIYIMCHDPPVHPVTGGVDTRGVGPGASQVHAQQAEGEAETLQNVRWSHVKVVLNNLLLCEDWWHVSAGAMMCVLHHREFWDCNFKNQEKKLRPHFVSSHQTWLHTLAQNWSPGDLSETVVVIATVLGNCFKSVELLKSCHSSHTSRPDWLYCAYRGDKKKILCYKTNC